MNININGKNIELKNTFRSHIIYEKITNEVFTPKNVTNIMLYFYSVVMASDMNLNLTFDDFMTWLDNNADELNRFTQWIINTTNKNGFINGSTDEKTEEEPKKA